MILRVKKLKCGIFPVVPRKLESMATTTIELKYPVESRVILGFLLLW